MEQHAESVVKNLGASLMVALMLTWFSASAAQPVTPGSNQSSPKSSVDPGALVTPPDTDSGTARTPGPVRKPPANIDPGMVETPPTKEEAAESRSGPKLKPKDPECAGSSASCNKTLPR